MKGPLKRIFDLVTLTYKLNLYILPLDLHVCEWTDTHTDSGDMSPTRTCVPYVLLAIV